MSSLPSFIEPSPILATGNARSTLNQNGDGDYTVLTPTQQVKIPGFGNVLPIGRFTVNVKGVPTLMYWMPQGLFVLPDGSAYLFLELVVTGPGGGVVGWTLYDGPVGVPPEWYDIPSGEINLNKGLWTPADPSWVEPIPGPPLAD